MNLQQLNYFYTVGNYNSVTTASECLYVSQPTISAAIKALEKEFGVSLFQRCHNGMIMTPEGEALFEMCKDILSRTSQLENIMKDLGDKGTKLRLGIPPMLGSLCIPNIFSKFQTTHPDIALEFFEDGGEELLDKLSKKYLDMVISSHKKNIKEKCEFEELSKLEVVCCASKDSPLAKLKYVTPQLLKDTPLVLFKENFHQTSRIKNWFAIEHINPNIVLQTEQLSTMLTMISSSNAVGFIFKDITTQNNTIVAIPMKTPMFATTYLAWRKNSYLSSSMKKFIEFMRETNPFQP